MTKKKAFLGHVTCFLGCVIISFILISKGDTSFKCSYLFMVGLPYVQSKLVNPFNFFSVQAKNTELKRENLALKLENSRLSQSQLQYKRLEEHFLKFKNTSKYDLILAKVVAQSPNQYQFDWVINVGSQDLIKIDMPVLTDQGVIGRIKKVYKEYSIVKVIQDKNFKLSVMSQRSREIGIVEPYSENLLKVSFLVQYNIFAGDTLITSGLGQIFPKGLPVGIVTFQEIEFETRAGRQFIIEPFVSYSKVEEVFIYKLLGVNNEK